MKLRFSSIRNGETKIGSWIHATVLVVGTLSCFKANAEPKYLPPPIEKQEQSTDSKYKTQQHYISGVPLGPHTPNLTGPHVGIIDSGIDPDHPQLKGLVISQKDFTGEGLGDSQGHGTKVALTLVQSYFALNKQLVEGKEAGTILDEMKLAELSPILSAKVIGKNPTTSQVISDRIVKAVRWLAKKQVQIVNISMALPEGAANYTELCNEIDSQREIFFSIAAGNAGAGSVVYPAACEAENILVVGALGSNGVVADYAGPSDIVASGDVSFETEEFFLRKEGDRLTQAGQFIKAKKAYTRVLSLNPSKHERAFSEYGLGYISLKQGDKDSALLFFEKSATSWPQNPEPYIAISILLTEKKRFETALQWLALAVKNDADSARIRNLFARILLDLDEPEKALGHINTLLQMSPDFEGATELLLTAQNRTNLLRYLDNGVSPTELLDAIIEAGDDGQLIGFLIRMSQVSPNVAIGENSIPVLVKAAALGRISSCATLLQLGSDINRHDEKYKITALMMAATKGYEKLTVMLILNGADLEKQDYAGFTALMFAAEAGHTAMVKYLIENKANPLVVSLEENTALDYAKKFDHHDVIKVLEQAVSEINRKPK